MPRACCSSTSIACSNAWDPTNHQAQAEARAHSRLSVCGTLLASASSIFTLTRWCVAVAPIGVFEVIRNRIGCSIGPRPHQRKCSAIDNVAPAIPDSDDVALVVSIRD